MVYIFILMTILTMSIDASYVDVLIHFNNIVNEKKAIPGITKKDVENYFIESDVVIPYYTKKLTSYIAKWPDDQKSYFVETEKIIKEYEEYKVNGQPDCKQYPVEYNGYSFTNDASKVNWFLKRICYSFKEKSYFPSESPVFSLLWHVTCHDKFFDKAEQSKKQVEEGENKLQMCKEEIQDLKNQNKKMAEEEIKLQKEILELKILNEDVLSLKEKYEREIGDIKSISEQKDQKIKELEEKDNEKEKSNAVDSKDFAIVQSTSTIKNNSNKGNQGNQGMLVYFFVVALLTSNAYFGYHYFVK